RLGPGSEPPCTAGVLREGVGVRSRLRSRSGRLRRLSRLCRPRLGLPAEPVKGERLFWSARSRLLAVRELEALAGDQLTDDVRDDDLAGGGALGDLLQAFALQRPHRSVAVAFDGVDADPQ